MSFVSGHDRRIKHDQPFPDNIISYHKMKNEKIIRELEICRIKPSEIVDILVWEH